MSQSRYAAYKDSGVAWLGQVPAHWQVVQSKYVFTKTYRPIENYHNQYQLLSLTLKGVIERNIDSGEGKYPADFSTYQLIEPNDIVFCLFDVEETPRTVGLSKISGMITSAYDVFTINAQHPNFYEYYFLYIDSGKHYSYYYTGLRKVVRTPTFLQAPLPLPPLAEQQAIAAFLDRECARIDALVAAQQRMIALLKEKRQAQISHAVTHGLDPAAPRKDSGVAWLGQVPAHWQVKRLKTNADVIPSNIDKKSYDDELPIQLCNYTDVYYNDLIVPDMPFMQATASQEQIQKFTLTAGDIIITKDSETADDIAIPAYVPQTLPNVVCGYHLALIRTTNDVIGKYLFYYFLSTQAKSYFETRANGLTRVGLGQAAIGNLPLPLPPLAEQQAIAAFLDRECARIDTLIGKAEQAIALLHERRSALIAAAVTGQIRVTNEE